MQCPTDGTQLLVSTRGGVEIDSCPRCHGVWLDRGELDKIIARADPQNSPRFPPSLHPLRGRREPADLQPDESRRDQRGQPAAKRENWLADLFD